MDDGLGKVTVVAEVAEGAVELRSNELEGMGAMATLKMTTVTQDYS